jgi:hypothetical protein
MPRARRSRWPGRARRVADLTSMSIRSPAYPWEGIRLHVREARPAASCDLPAALSRPCAVATDNLYVLTHGRHYVRPGGPGKQHRVTFRSCRDLGCGGRPSHDQSAPCGSRAQRLDAPRTARIVSRFAHLAIGAAQPPRLQRPFAAPVAHRRDDIDGAIELGRRSRPRGPGSLVIVVPVVVSVVPPTVVIVVIAAVIDAAVPIPVLRRPTAASLGRRRSVGGGPYEASREGHHEREHEEQACGFHDGVLCNGCASHHRCRYRARVALLRIDANRPVDEAHPST